VANDPRLRGALDSVPEYRAGRPAPPGAFKLSSNENAFPPLPGVIAAVTDAVASANRYPDFASSRLIAALAELHGVEHDALALGTGSVAVLAQTIQAVAGSGDEVVIPWRSFEAYPILVQLAGATLVPVPLRSNHCHDLDAMADAVTERTRLVMVCSPNNPTGTIVTRSELDRFLERVPSDVLVAVDEAYVEFVGPAASLDALNLVASHPNVMVLRTFSKAYGLAALRVGYAVASPSIARGLRKTQLPFGVSTVAEQAALASLAGRCELMRRVRQIIVERDRICAELRAMGTDFPEPHGNFVWLPLGEVSVSFAEVCERNGVIVRAFAGEGVRVTVGEPPGNDRFLQTLREFC
jgi:histidinol-phosphate aminotransferase